MDEFKIVVDRLDEEAEHSVFQATADWWAARDEGNRDEFCVVEIPFVLSVEASRVRDEVLLEGDLTGRVELECGRCAKRYSHALHDTFRLVLLPAKDRRSSDPGAADPEGEQGLAEKGLCLGEELESGWFRGPVIQLDDLCGEMIALAMPLQPLCHSECLGICPHCGQERCQERGQEHERELGEGRGTGRDTARCECVDEKIDSPFAVLAQLKGSGE